MLAKFISREFKSIERFLDRKEWVDSAFDKALERVEKLAETISKWFAWTPDIDATPMAVTLDGTADAFGTDSFAQAELDANIVDYGSAAVAHGSASFRAAAEGDAEVALTDAFGEVTGADFVLQMDTDIQGENWAVSTHRFIALDLDFLDFPDLARVDVAFAADVDDRAQVGDGNIATATFDAAVDAPAGAVDVVAEVLAVEDVLSGSSLQVTLAIG